MGSIRKKSTSLTDRVACIILAGGQGSRLFPLTMYRCKPAVSFGGRYRLIDVPISNSLNSKMKNIFVVSQYFSSGLNQHIQETYPLDNFQGGTLSFLNPEERISGKIWYKGTADAVRKNLNCLLKLPIDYFLILSGDQLYNMDLKAMVSFARRKGADLTIAALPISKQEAPRLGVLNINAESEIIDFEEKPKDPAALKKLALSSEFLNEHNIRNAPSPCFLASMGIYVIKRDALLDLLGGEDREDFGKNVIPAQIKKGKSFAFLYQGYWEDIGTISSFYEANLALTTNSLGLDLYNEIFPIYAHNHFLPGARIHLTHISDSLVCDGSVIKGKEIKNSIIGIRSTINKGTIIRDSILLGNEYYTAPDGNGQESKRNFEIGENCLIEKTIIDENVTIGNHVILTNQQKLKKYDGDGIYIRDGIIVVASGTTLPDHFTL